MKRFLCCLFFVFFGLSGMALAETVRLKNGKVVEGELIEKTADYVKVRVEGLDLTYWKDDLENSVEDKTLGSPVEGKKQLTPKEIYLAYYAALEKKNWPQMKKYLTEDLIKQKEVSPGRFESEVFRKFTVNTMKVVKEIITNSDARFVIIALGQTTQGVVRHHVVMKKIGDEWRISEESWLKGDSKERGRAAGGRGKAGALGGERLNDSGRQR